LDDKRIEMVSEVLEGTNWFHSKGKFIQRINCDMAKKLDGHKNYNQHQKIEGGEGLELEKREEHHDDNGNVDNFTSNLHHRMWRFSNQQLTIDPPLPHCSRFQTSINMNKGPNNANEEKNDMITIEESSHSKMRKTSLSYLNKLSQMNGKKLDYVEMVDGDGSHLSTKQSKSTKSLNKISKFTSKLLNRVIQSIYK